MKAFFNDRPIYISFRKLDVSYEDNLEPSELTEQEIQEVFETYADEIQQQRSEFASMYTYDRSKGE